MTRDRDNWFRKASWTEDDQTDFFAHLTRSRTAYNKAQYLRIQASTLLETGQPQLLESALGLAEKACLDFPNASDRAWVLEIGGQCCAALGRTDEAIAYYRHAIEHERAHPGLRGHPGLRLALLIVEGGRAELYSEALAAVECKDFPVFPSQAYVMHGVRAIVAHHAGHIEQAQSMAKSALEAAAVTDTGLSHGRGNLGTVKNKRETFHRMLLSIWDAKPEST